MSNTLDPPSASGTCRPPPLVLAYMTSFSCVWCVWMCCVQVINVLGHRTLFQLQSVKSTYRPPTHSNNLLIDTSNRVVFTNTEHIKHNASPGPNHSQEKTKACDPRMHMQWIFTHQEWWFIFKAWRVCSHPSHNRSALWADLGANCVGRETFPLSDCITLRHSLLHKHWCM